jgi:hypothetical protein
VVAVVQIQALEPVAMVQQLMVVTVVLELP